MTRIALAFALSAMVGLVAGMGPASADGLPTTPRGPKYYQSPTDDYQPPRTRSAPRARAEDTELSDLFLPRRTPPPPRLGTGGAQIYTYRPMVEPRPTYYYYAPPAAQDVFDNAPCPTRARYSLAPLFDCTQ